MSDTPTIKWRGQSGKTYLYYIHPIGTPFKAGGGNYIFAKKSEPSKWSPVYIGQTNDLNERLEKHEKIESALAYGATHVHAHVNGSKVKRLAEERDLIEYWQPPCNG